ncbi:MAG: hypothetical protein D6729_13500 [Deltaproteobacteria bacterium]|nr:MAG: hypothetical protein D6729_13500 [Deltaproteobacteria bacterium]
MPPGAPACLRRLVPGEAVAGGVESWVRRAGRWTRRASFVALRPGAALALSELPGWDEERAARCAPFPPGAPTSVGVDAVGRAWTLYFRARGAGAPQWRLEPVAVFRCPEGEVGIYVAPAAAAERAYLRTGPHALSYRIREGTVAGPRVDALMQWAAGALSPDGRRIRGEPPSPWARY